jgi:hypothetical protein
MCELSGGVAQGLAIAAAVKLRVLQINGDHCQEAVSLACADATIPRSRTTPARRPSLPFTSISQPDVGEKEYARTPTGLARRHRAPACGDAGNAGGGR